MGLPYMPTLTPMAPPQLIGIYGSPMECLGHVFQIGNLTSSEPKTRITLTQPAQRAFSAKCLSIGVAAQTEPRPGGVLRGRGTESR